jgi:hypothetical protein
MSLHTSIGCRECDHSSHEGGLTPNRHFFPSTEPETENEEEWEEVKAEASAENGAPEIEVEADKLDGRETSSKAETDDNTTKSKVGEVKPRVQLPDVPTQDPEDDGPATKKQKSEG